MIVSTNFLYQVGIFPLIVVQSKELGEYKDSSAKLKEVADSKIYENALKAIDEGRYSRALDEFKKIKDYLL